MSPPRSAAPVGNEVRAFAARLGKAADALAVLFYGSNLRTGSLEGVLDFYVLLPGGVESGIWPRVSYHEWANPESDCSDVTLRAKVATMTLATFRAAAGGDLLDTTIRPADEILQANNIAAIDSSARQK